jgi:glycosyltransferase involved in cell wall biosynthesis
MRRSRPDISVVVPTRNRARLVLTAVRSVLAQRDADFEVVVVDDASIDDTVKLLTDLDSPSMRVVCHAHPQRVSVARNRGIAEARGTWVAFLDDDDVWAPNKLSLQLAEAERTRRRWAFTGAVTVDAQLRAVAAESPNSPEQVVTDLARYNAVPVGASNVAVRADVLAATGGFDPGLRHMADWDLWIRLALTGLPATVDRPLVGYRLHAGNATNDSAFDSGEVLAELATIETRHRIRADRAAVERWIGAACLRAGQRRAAMRAYGRAVRAGDVSSAARLLGALVHPQVGRRLSYRPWQHRGEDAERLAEAQAWLDGLIA